VLGLVLGLALGLRLGVGLVLAAPLGPMGQRKELGLPIQKKDARPMMELVCLHPAMTMQSWAQHLAHQLWAHSRLCPFWEAPPQKRTASE